MKDIETYGRGNDQLPNFEYEQYPYGYSKCFFCVYHRKMVEDLKDKTELYIKEKDTHACYIYPEGISHKILKTPLSFPDRETNPNCLRYRQYKYNRKEKLIKEIEHLINSSEWNNMPDWVKNIYISSLSEYENGQDILNNLLRDK